jgi:hypothetical protein
MKRSWAGEVRNVSLLVAIGVTSEGYREILGICEGAKEDKSGWSAFLRHLVDRGLEGVELITSDACRGLVESAAEYLPEARWQRCVVGLLKKVAWADSLETVEASGDRGCWDGRNAISWNCSSPARCASSSRTIMSSPGSTAFSI